MKMATAVIAILLLQILILQAAEENDNIALDKPTYQTSTYNGRTSDRAVDGILDTNISAQSWPCARIRNPDEQTPAEWWVNLENVFIVKNITIHSSIRTVDDKMTNFLLGVIKVNGEERICVEYSGIEIAGGDYATFTCPDNTIGQYVHFKRTGEPFIHGATICELQVTGTRYDEPSRTEVTATQTSNMKSPTQVSTATASAFTTQTPQILTTQSLTTQSLTEPLPTTPSLTTPSPTTPSPTTLALDTPSPTALAPTTSSPTTPSSIPLPTPTPLTTKEPQSTTDPTNQPPPTTLTTVTLTRETYASFTSAATQASPTSTIAIINTTSPQTTSESITLATSQEKTSLSETSSVTAEMEIAVTRPSLNLSVVVAVPIVACILIVVIIVIGVIFWRRRYHKQDIESIKPPETSSIAEPKSPTDPLEHFVAAADLKDYVRDRSMENNPFEEEFNSLPEPDMDTCTFSLMDIHMHKNRYKNILCYDDTRVVLECEEEDPNGHYINASYIKGYKDIPKTYIATQGPRSNTVVDFWRMVWKEGVTRILMVANITEKKKSKVHPYWPQSPDIQEEFGSFRVTVEAEEVFMDYTTRMLLVEFEGKERRVRHFHFTTWPDMQPPLNGPISLINFNKHLHSFDNQCPGPIVIHCSAGVGRTGTVIAFDILQQQLKDEGKVAIFRCVSDLRHQRMMMVQTKIQYVFLHEVLMEVATVGNTAYPCNGFFTMLQALKREGNKGTSELYKEFKLMCSMKTFSERSSKSGYESVNINKNRDNKVVPADDVRPYLSTPDQQGNHYINAAYVDSYKKPRRFIVTQSPLAHTKADFWRLVYDQGSSMIITLNNICDDLEEDEDVEIENGRSASPYWPDNKGVPETYGPLVVEVLSEKDVKEDIISREITVHSLARPDNARKVKQIQLLGWKDDAALPPRTDAILDLIDLMLSHQQMKSSKDAETMGEVIVHCLSGRGPSGIFCGVSFTLDKMKVEQEVDAFQAARHLSKSRPEFFQSLEEYEYLYNSAVTYMTRYDTYGNFQ